MCVNDSLTKGREVGREVGVTVGKSVGVALGAAVGFADLMSVGMQDGGFDGAEDGAKKDSRSCPRILSSQPNAKRSLWRPPSFLRARVVDTQSKRRHLMVKRVILWAECSTLSLSEKKL